jgi:hypothetical protein
MRNPKATSWLPPIASQREAKILKSAEENKQTIFRLANVLIKAVPQTALTANLAQTWYPGAPMQTEKKGCISIPTGFDSLSFRSASHLRYRL